MTDETERFRYSLIVKADHLSPGDVTYACKERGFAVWDTEQGDSCVYVRIQAASDVTNALNEWMGEDAGEGPPFRDGSLLYWRPIDSF